MLAGMSFIVWGDDGHPKTAGEVIDGPQSGFVLCRVWEKTGARVALVPVACFEDRGHVRTGSAKLFPNREARLDWEKNCALVGSYYY